MAGVDSSSGLVEKFRRQLEKKPDRQTDHVGDAALDSLDQRRSQGLDRVAPRTSLPLAELDVALLLGLAQPLEGHRGALEPGPLLAMDDDRQAAHDLMRPAGHAVQVAARLSRVDRLAQRLAV